jgi:hypothetical protein
MPIVFVNMIHRHDCKAEPEARFVFGDNTTRRGLGGQAAEMRGEPNSIGVCTKRTPGMVTSSFFSDMALADWAIMKEDLKQVAQALEEDRKVYVPSGGLGTERAMLPQRAPRMYRYLYNWFNKRAKGKCPWPKPKKEKDL